MSAVDFLREHLAELTAATGISGKIVEADQRLYLVLDDVLLPVGRFSVDRTSVLFITDYQYPLSAMDMFWVDVEVLRPDGRVPQGAESIESYIGRQWRRFSWHRQGAWRVSGNPLLDHYALMEARWDAEPRNAQAA